MYILFEPQTLETRDYMGRGLMRRDSKAPTATCTVCRKFDSLVEGIAIALVNIATPMNASSYVRQKIKKTRTVAKLCCVEYTFQRLIKIKQTTQKYFSGCKAVRPTYSEAPCFLFALRYAQRSRGILYSASLMRCHFDFPLGN